MFTHAILTHGGAGSDPAESDGPQASAKIGLQMMKEGLSAFDAVIQSVKYLEDDPRFNAGVGSRIRKDKKTIQMDAACMKSSGEFGAVSCVEGIKNPILIAKEVLTHSSHIIISGDGVRQFALEHKLPIEDLPTHNEYINEKKSACDTVGAVAFDGKEFAVALSSGGIAGSSVGRVGDVPLPGCGLFCGPIGAIACTGDGEFIALKILAREVYGWLESGMKPDDAAEKALSLFEETVDIGLIILTKTEFASKAKNQMAWAQLTER